MNRQSFVLLCSFVTLFALPIVPCNADYILTPLWDGPGPAQIAPGVPFNIKFDLTSTAGNVCDSAIFDAQFSSPKMVVNSYSWGGSFNGSGFDGSDPSNFHFENFILSGPDFSSGTLLSMNLTLPTDIAQLPSSLSVSANPGVFASLGQEFTPLAGPTLTINVVPEPSTMTLIFVGASILSIVGNQTLVRRKT